LEIEHVYNPMLDNNKKSPLPNLLNTIQ